MRQEFDHQLKHQENNILEKYRPALEASQNQAQDIARTLQNRESAFNEIAFDWQKTLSDLEAENSELRDRLNRTTADLKYSTQLAKKHQDDQSHLAEKLKSAYKSKSQRFKIKI